MKSRRLMIFCVALVALAGTPRAWQEAGKLLAAVQHKAQVKFWSLVLQPKNRESAATELVARASRPSEISPASLDSNCPLEPVTTQRVLASSNSRAGRRVDSASFQPQRKAQRENTSVTTPLSHTGLIAKAVKASRGDSNAESLRHSRSIPESELSGVSEIRPSLMALASKSAAPLPPASKNEAFKFVMIPAPSPAVSALVEKENLLRLKVLRKAIEEPKTIRQKTRLPVVRGTAAFFPAS